MGAVTDGTKKSYTPYIKFLMYSGSRGFVISRNKFYFSPQASRRFTKCNHKFGCFKFFLFQEFLNLQLQLEQPSVLPIF